MRKDVVEAARSMLGVKYTHQGRSAATGVDCVGLLVEVGRLIGYPFEIHDIEVYKRTPQPKVLIDTLRLNMIEIPVDEVEIGDVWLMTVGGRKPRHTAIRSSEDKLIHALNKPPIKRVCEQWIDDYERGFVKGFRIREWLQS